MDTFSSLGLLGLGTFIGLIVDRLIGIAKIQHDIKKDRFQLKVNEYAEWITKSKNILDVMSDMSFSSEGIQEINESINYERIARNDLKKIADKLVLLFTKSERDKLQNIFDEYFNIWKNLLELNYKFRDIISKEESSDLNNLYAEMKNSEKKLFNINSKIIMLFYKDIDL